MRIHREKAKYFYPGPSGVGKSHLAQALGHQACRRELDVLFYCTHQLFEWIYAGRGDGSRNRRFAQVSKIPLLILDDLVCRLLMKRNKTIFIS